MKKPIGRLQMTSARTSVPTSDLDDTIAGFAASAERLAQVRAAVAREIFGQSEVVEQCLSVLLAGGHGLIVGVPGLGKTKLVDVLAGTMGLSSRRVQCTPDLMPADILGSEVLDQDRDGARRFRFIEGPVFTELLMADEINRASPRTQSALLQAMAERRVAVAGINRELPAPFHVLATQNPLEHEGTYPLPEAQLDRFLLEIRIDYPNVEDERAMLLATTGMEAVRTAPVLDAAELMALQRLVRSMPVSERVLGAIIRLVRGARPQTPILPELATMLSWGPGPRAAQALMLTCRARALLHRREAPGLEDVAALAAPVLRHRLGLGFAARAEGADIEALIPRLVAAALG
jgi:MoxR-like ATPase